MTPSGGDTDIVGALNNIVAAISDSGGLPDPAEASAGDVLSLDEDKKPTWSTPTGGLPETTLADAGKVLTVKSDGTEAEWKNIPNELPAIASGDASKVLKVNSSGTGTEWAAAGGNPRYMHRVFFTAGGVSAIINMISSYASSYYGTSGNRAFANTTYQEGYTSQGNGLAGSEQLISYENDELITFKVLSLYSSQLGNTAPMYVALKTTYNTSTNTTTYTYVSGTATADSDIVTEI